MLWFKRISLSLCLLVLASCATSSVDEAGKHAALGEVTLSITNDRIGQLYRQQLNRTLSRHGHTGSRYELSVSLNSNDGDDAVDMVAAMSLYDRSVGKIITRKTLHASASVGAVSSLYGSEEAKRHARERLAAQLASKTYQYLMLYFVRTADNES